MRKLKKLKKFSAGEEFLKSLKKELSDYMAFYPVRKGPDSRLLKIERSNLLFITNFLKFKHMTALIIALIIALSGGGVTLASQGSIPGDALYGVKTLSENARSVLAVTPEAKAKLAAKLAAARVEEVQKILAARGVEPKGLEIALSRLEKHIAEAAEAINKAKGRGKDVSALAKAVSNNLDSQTGKLGNVFKEERDSIKNKIKELQNQIKEAESAGDNVRGEDLAKRLETARAEREELNAKEEKTEKAIEEKTEEIKNSLEIKEAAEKALAEAKEAYENILKEIAEKKITVSEDTFSQYNDFIVKAEEALKNEHYVQARQHAKQAKDALKHAEKAIERVEMDETGVKNNNGKSEEKIADTGNKAIEKNNKNGDRENKGSTAGKEEENKTEDGEE